MSGPSNDAIPNNGAGDAAQQQQAAENAEINANSTFPRIPLPTLVEGAADAYFLSMEFWFAASGVTSDLRKFNTVLAQVPPTKLQELATIIAATPANDKYEYIKAALIKHFADSQARRLQRVLSEMPLGDLRPSQLYHNMARVAGNALGETALRDLWASRLPPFTQAAVVAATGNLAEVLATADRVNDSLALRQNQVANIAPEPQPQPNAQIADLARLIQQIDETFRRFRDEIPRERGGRNRSRENRPRTRGNSRQRADQAGSNDNNGLCWYHAEFGRQAQNCREPCVWARTNAAAAPAPAAGSNGTN